MVGRKYRGIVTWAGRGARFGSDGYVGAVVTPNASWAIVARHIANHAYVFVKQKRAKARSFMHSR